MLGAKSALYDCIVVDVFHQYLQDGEVVAAAMEAAGGHREPCVTQDVVDRNRDARHGQSGNHMRHACAEVYQIPSAGPFV